MSLELHAISTGAGSKHYIVQSVAAIAPFVHFVHLREKVRSPGELLSLVHSILAAGVPSEKIVINDRVDVALMVTSGAVQLPWTGLPVREVKRLSATLRCGVSVHSLEEALVAQEEGADYLMYGHVYETNSKPGLAPHGVEQLAILCETLTVPVIALGGIRCYHIPELVSAGASGIAVMSGIWNTAQPGAAAAEYREKLNAPTIR